MNRSTVETRLRVAIRNLIVDEYSLFASWALGRPASEIAVCAQLARHFAPTLPRTWDVDCEYNRADVHLVKQGTTGRTRRADLIVHRRTGLGPANNLLLAEVKTVLESAGSGGTVESLQDLMTAHHYRHGVFLQLDCDRDGPSPRWQWFGDEPDDPAPRAVFEPGTLKVVLAEARAYWEVRQALTGREQPRHLGT